MWLYVPHLSTSSPSAPAEEASTLASDWQCQALARSAWWRGKPSPSRTWSQRCERVSWMKLLSGAMPEPSTAAHGVAALTASLAASRASRIASPASASLRKTSATSGARHGASSSRPGPGSSSSRMSAACSPAGGQSAYGETFADLVTRSRSDYSRRRRSVRATNASGSSSSAWPTASTSTGGADLARRDTGRPNSSLATAISIWPPPTSRDHRSIEASDATHDRNARPLSEFVGQWSTPRASDGEKGGPNQSFGAGGQPPPSQASSWATPRSEMARALGNPKHICGRRGKGNLEDQVVAWPDARDLYSPLAQVTVKAGKPSSLERRSLNPLFVEWLMGWPPSWTLLVSTDFGCSAMALSRFKRDMRSALSHLALHDAPPAQASLFG